jgi:beta-glucosidase
MGERLKCYLPVRYNNGQHEGDAMKLSRQSLPILLLLVVLLLTNWPAAHSQQPIDADWTANTRLEEMRTVSDPELGAAQGVSYRDGKLYFYGDVHQAKPRVGIIREYALDLKPTGRDIRLARHGKPVLVHPTGLAWDAEFGCFLGDTVNKVATIYKLDWDRALKDGNLDNAVLAEIRDDAAVNGCRPEYVTLGRRRLLATADYGDIRPAVRLYDPRRLVESNRSSAPGVCVATIPSGPFNQNLYWDASRGELTCVQNVVAGLGWKLDVFNLEKAVAAGKLEPARVRTLTFRPHTELEGWLRQPDGREVFVTSSPQHNIYVGKSRTVETYATPKGTWGLAPDEDAEFAKLFAKWTEKPPIFRDAGVSLEARLDDLIGRLTLEEKATLLNHNGPEVERFHIRADRWNQCLHGVWWDRPTTMFPVPIALAATWDDALVHKVAETISDEARAIYNGWHIDPKFPGEHKGLIYRAPVINISRNPYWGRINECYGEDPFLTGRMGVAFVRGLQGDDPRHLKLAATLKHFAVNNVEKDRQQLSAKVDERMLHEYWLPHFRACVEEGKVCSVMASYNAINGTPNNMNHLLLTDILKKQWGFQGFVVSDLGGVGTMVRGHERGKMDFVDAVARSLEAGCDFSDKEFMDNIPAAIRSGKLSEARLDDALRRVLRVRFRLGEFDPPEMVPYSRIKPDVICSPEHRKLALQAARESIVLLTNRDHTLPLDRTKLRTIAVIGPRADKFIAGGYSGKAIAPVTPLAGLRAIAGPNVEIKHITSAADAGKADVAIAIVGTTLQDEAEGRDRTSLGLPRNQEQLVRDTIAANPRTVVVLQNAGPLTIPWINEHAASIIEAWWGGEEGGTALAEAIFGDINPAGRLPYTVYASADQVPPQDEYDVSRGFTYMYLKGDPLFAFGHGLSYTGFRYGNLVCSPQSVDAAGRLAASVDVENAGNRSGDEVVQLYIRTVDSHIARPHLQLRAFRRVPLAAGEKKTIKFELPATDLGYFDVSQHAFRVEPGQYELLVGSSSQDIWATAKFRVVK